MENNVKILIRSRSRRIGNIRSMILSNCSKVSRDWPIILQKVTKITLNSKNLTFR